MAETSDPGFGTYAQGAGTLFSVIGQIMAASQARKLADYNAEVADANAQAAAQAAEMEAQQHTRQVLIAAQDIQLTRQAQQWLETEQRRQQDYVAGQTEAIIASSGLMMRGSPLAVYEDTLRRQERTILAGRYAAHLKERALQDQITMESYAADVSRYGGSERLRIGKAQTASAQYAGGQQQFASSIGAVGTLLSGGAKTYETYEKERLIKTKAQTPTTTVP